MEKYKFELNVLTNKSGFATRSIGDEVVFKKRDWWTEIEKIVEEYRAKGAN